MHLDNSNPPTEMVWAGYLEYEDERESTQLGGSKLPELQIGKPVWWTDRAIMGEKWIAPVGNFRFGLARFAFSLIPIKTRQEVKRAELIVNLYAHGTKLRPTAYDLQPLAVTQNETSTRTIGISPSFKFVGGVELSGPKAETTIELKYGVPVITSYGIGHSRAGWIFESRVQYPLIGNQVVYMVIQIPSEVVAACVTLEVKAETQDSIFGLLRGIVPRTQQEKHLSFVLE